MLFVLVYTRYHKERIWVIYMKKILTIMVAMMLVASMASCGKDKSVSQGGGIQDENGNVIQGTTIDGAIDEVDMDKIDGEIAQKQEDTNENTKATIADLDVKMGDAKIMTIDNHKVIILSFDYKNKTDEPTSFDSNITVEVTQEAQKLTAPVDLSVLNNIEGLNIRSSIETVDKGKSATVQKAYVLRDDQTPVTVNVYKYGEPSGEGIYKTFTVK